MDKDKQEHNIDQLIDTLADDLKPRGHLLHPFLRVSPWLVIALCYLVGVVHFLGLRMDWHEKLAETTFVFELALTGLIAAFAGYSAGWLAVPDMREQRWLLSVPTTLFGVFLLLKLSEIFVAGFHIPALTWHFCFSDALLMGIVPVALLLMLVRRGATTRPYWLAFMSVLSVSALGWGALRLTCSADNSGHTLFFHFMPFILMAALFGSLARRLYRW